MRKVVLFTSALTAALLLLTGCNTAAQDHGGVQQPAGGQARNLATETNQPKTARLAHSPELSLALQQVEHIREAVVLLDEQQNAYVALRPAVDLRRVYVRAPFEARPGLRVKAADKIPLPVQEAVAEAIRRQNPAVRTIYMTDSTRHYQRFQETAMHHGKVGVMDVQTSDEQIKAIWD